MRLLAWRKDRRVATLWHAFLAFGFILGVVTSLIAIGDHIANAHQVELYEDLQLALTRMTKSNAFGIPAYVFQNGEWFYVGFLPTVGQPIKIDLSATYLVIQGTPP